jgi:glutathione S-transferase
MLFVDAFFSNPFDFRCYVALEEKRLEFAVARVMVAEGQGLAQAYRERSVTARVPGLAHGDFWLAESLAITEYLEEVFPAPGWARLYPADARARARARQVHSFLGSDLTALVAERPASLISYPVSCAPLTPPARVAADELLALVERLTDDGFLDEWSLAAADLTFTLLRLSRSGEALPPRAQALVEANLARRSVRSYLTHDRPPHPPRTGRRVAV